MSVALLVWWPLVLQSAGLLVVAMSGGLVAAGVGVVVHAIIVDVSCVVSTVISIAGITPR